MAIILKPEFRAAEPAPRQMWIEQDSAVAVETATRGTKRRRYKLRRKVREERSQRILHAAAQAIVVTDSQGTISDWNLRATELLGWPRDSVTGRRFQEFLPDDQVAVFSRFLSAALVSSGAAGDEALSLHARHRDGASIELAASASVVPVGGELSIALFLHRHSILDLDTDALAGHHDAIESAIDAFPSNAFVKDLRGNFAFANQACAERVNLPLSEVIGYHHSKWLPPDAVACVEAVDAEVIATGRAQAFTLAFNRGSSISVERVLKTPYRGRSGRIIGIFCVARDITASRFEPAP